jgi:hypothetical protein
MIRLGSGVFVRALPDVVSAGRWQRAVLVGVLAAILVGAVLTVTAVLFHWVDAPVVRAAIGVVLTSFGGGAVAAAFVRLAPDGSPRPWRSALLGTGSPTPTRTTDWRTQERLVRYLGWSPPPIRPADRELVLADVELGRRVVAAALVHSGLASVGFVLVGVGVFGGGLFADSEFRLPFVFVFLTLGSFFSQILTLGRGERARRQAEAIPIQVWGEPAPPRPRGDRRPRSPGSKLSLPDE